MSPLLKTSDEIFSMLKDLQELKNCLVLLQLKQLKIYITNSSAFYIANKKIHKVFHPCLH